MHMAVSAILTILSLTASKEDQSYSSMSLKPLKLYQFLCLHTFIENKSHKLVKYEGKKRAIISRSKRLGFESQPGHYFPLDLNSKEQKTFVGKQQQQKISSKVSDIRLTQKLVATGFFFAAKKKNGKNVARKVLI